MPHLRLSTFVLIVFSLAAFAGYASYNRLPAMKRLLADNSSEPVIGHLKVENQGVTRDLILNNDEGLDCTVLYVIQSACKWCAANELDFVKFSNALARNEHRHCRLIVYSLDSIPGGKIANLEVFRGMSTSEVFKYSLWQTPQTIVLDRHGHVKARISGKYSAASIRALEKFVGSVQ